MAISKKDTAIFLMILFTLVLPLLIGLFMQNYSDWSFVSIPFHAFLETAGAIIAFILTLIIFLMYQSQLEFNHFHRASFALIAMGVFDAFHAMTYPGELFVWLHSLAIFFGGMLFSFVWLSNLKVSKVVYFYLPVFVFVITSLVSIFSIYFPSIVPQMLDSNKEFTTIANLLNIIGGAMFILASFYFIKAYMENEETDNLLFAGHTMLFGSAGLLFFFSTLWDMQWWFWHILRFIAYVISLYFMLRIFYRNMISLELSNKKILNNNEKLNKSVKLLEEYKTAVYQGSIISVSDLQGNIKFVNDALLEITEYSEEELIGKPHNVFRDPDTPKVIFKEMWETIKAGNTFKGLIKNRTKSGKSFYVKITIVPIKDDNGNIFEYLALRDNVTELVKSQKELKSQFFTDPLTKLNNRFKLDEDVKDNEKIHLALLNIDNFKNVNDFYGQHFGDKVMKKVSDILLDMTYKYNYGLYRNHSDEFILIAQESKSFGKFFEDINNIIKRITNSKITIDKETIEITLSGGICENSNDITKADIALKEAKRLKKECVIYNDELDIEKIFEKNIQWSKKIKNALDNDKIEIVLQPIYSNIKNSVEKYESLIRLIDESDNVHTPFEFLDVAKRTRLYANLTQRVIKKSFIALNQLQKPISINICAEDIFNETTRYYLINMLKESNLSNMITLELVESEGIENFSLVKEFIEDVQQMGTKISIDDFGTGYSNFEYLLKLKADFIKIDGSLIKNIDTDSNSYNVVETIVTFAKKNNMKVIAEFVSSENIQLKIKELDIEYSQGYYIDKPKFLRQIV